MGWQVWLLHTHWHYTLYPNPLHSSPVLTWWSLGWWVCQWVWTARCLPPAPRCVPHPLPVKQSQPRWGTGPRATVRQLPLGHLGACVNHQQNTCIHTNLRGRKQTAHDIMLTKWDYSVLNCLKNYIYLTNILVYSIYRINHNVYKIRIFCLSAHHSHTHTHT